MAKLGKATVEITGNLKPLRNALKAARKTVVRSAKRIGRMGFRAMSRAVKRASRSISRFVKIIGVAFVAAIGLAIKTAAAFQKQMAMVNTMLDDAAREKGFLPRYSKALKQLSKDFGESTKTLSKGLFDILSASVSAGDALDFLRTSATAAVAGMTDTAVSVDLLTTIMNSFGLEASDVGMISDKLFATVKKGKTTFPELAGSLGRVAATASVAGMSLDELLAITATVTRGVGSTEESITSIVGVLRAFLSPQDEAVEAAKEFGLELNTTTLKTIGFRGAVKLLTKANAEQLSKIVSNIRGFRAMAVALKDQTGLMNDFRFISQESAGAAQEAFAIMADTTSFKFGQLKQTIVGTFRALGEPLLEPIKQFMDIIRAEFESLTKSFETNFSGIETAGDAVVSVFQTIIDKIHEYVAIAKDPKKGLTDAFTLMFEDLKKVFTKGWLVFKEKVLPVIEEVGRALGRAFMEAFGEQLEEAKLRIVFPKLMKAIDAERTRQAAPVTQRARQIQFQEFKERQADNFGRGKPVGWVGSDNDGGS